MDKVPQGMHQTFNFTLVQARDTKYTARSGISSHS